MEYLYDTKVLPPQIIVLDDHKRKEYAFTMERYSKHHFIYFFKFIYLFLAVLGLPCCTWAFSSCGERGLLFVTVHVLLIAVASLAAKHRPQSAGPSVVVACGLSGCGSRALERRLSSCGAQA